MSDVVKSTSGAPELPEVALQRSQLDLAAREIVAANLAFRQGLKRGMPTAEAYEKLRALAPADIEMADLPYWAGKVHEARIETDNREKTLADSEAVKRGDAPSEVEVRGIEAAENQLARVIGGRGYNIVRHGSSLTSNDALAARDRELADESRPQIAATLKAYEEAHPSLAGDGPSAPDLEERLEEYHQAVTVYERLKEPGPLEDRLIEATGSLAELAPADIKDNNAARDQWAIEQILARGIGRDDALANFYQAEREMADIGPVALESIEAEAKYERALSAIVKYAPDHLWGREAIAEWAQAESVANFDDILEKYRDGTATIEDLRPYAPIDADNPEKLAEWAKEVSGVPAAEVSLAEPATNALAVPAEALTASSHPADPVALTEALDQYREAAATLADVSPVAIDYEQYDAAYEKALDAVRSFAPEGFETQEALAGWADAAAAANLAEQRAAHASLGEPGGDAPASHAEVVPEPAAPVDPDARASALEQYAEAASTLADVSPVDIDYEQYEAAYEKALDAVRPFAPAGVDTPEALAQWADEAAAELAPPAEAWSQALETHVDRIEGLLDAVNDSEPGSASHESALQELIQFAPDNVSRENVVAWAEAVSDAANVCRDMPADPGFAGPLTVAEAQLVTVLGGENWQEVADQEQLANPDRVAQLESSVEQVIDDVAEHIEAQIERIDFDINVRVGGYIAAAEHLEVLGAQHASPAEYAEAHQAFEAAEEALRGRAGFYAPDAAELPPEAFDAWANQVWDGVDDADRQLIAEPHSATPGELGQQLAERLSEVGSSELGSFSPGEGGLGSEGLGGGESSPAYDHEPFLD
jgi:hypothetical protein